MLRLLCAAVLLSVGAVLLAAEPSPEEQKRLEATKKQEEFKKEYSSKDPNEQLKALDLLDVTTNPESWAFLISAVRQNPSKTVRLAAFKKLCAVPAKTPKLGETLANLFQEAVKPSEVETRIEFAQEMGKSEFKYAIFEALADYGSKLRYPDLYSGTWTGRNQGGGGTLSTIGGDP
ncbi:MAG: hypothetical protein NTW87_34585, partial [Planctomycetota bacterium]|nr:hypothetical protein [Planctomycetota bacterium]